MTTQSIARLRARVSEMRDQINKYESAICVLEAEEKALEKQHARKPMMLKVRRKMAVPNKSGALVGFARKYDTGAQNATLLARELLPIARKEGLKVTTSSLASAIRRHREGLDPTIVEMEQHIKQYGPMPFGSIRGWLEEAHPDVKTGTHHPTLVRLNVLKNAGRVVNENGAFRVVEATH